MHYIAPMASLAKATASVQALRVEVGRLILHQPKSQGRHPGSVMFSFQQAPQPQIGDKLRLDSLVCRPMECGRAGSTTIRLMAPGRPQYGLELNQILAST
jgi:hypothetical protein